MKIKTLFLILFSLLCSYSVYAQKSKKLTITGAVYGVDRLPIRNAIIMIDDEKTNSTTDSEGKYKIKVRADAKKIMIFTFGNGTREEEIRGRSRIDFNFSTTAIGQSDDQENSVSDEAVNSGYRVDKRKYVTTEISKIDGSDEKYASYSSIYDMIQREVAGAKIGSSGIILQDSRNLQGSVAALLIVDGVMVESLSNISPRAVSSIEVLKGTSAAMYGSRGYGGVIIIKTKTSTVK